MGTDKWGRMTIKLRLHIIYFEGTNMEENRGRLHLSCYSFPALPRPPYKKYYLDNFKKYNITY